MTEDIMFTEYLVPLERFHVRCESIENRAHNPGYPDVNYFKRTGNGTLELKWLAKLKDTNTPDWQQGQIAKNRTLQYYSDKIYLLLWVQGIFYLINVFQHSYTREELLQGRFVLWQGPTLDRSFTTIL